MAQSRPDYGVDGPIAVKVLLVLGGLLLATVAILVVLGAPQPYGNGPRVAMVFIGTDLLAIAGGMLGYSKFAKEGLRERLLGEISWRGDESVLDVGCGRGLWLIGAARRLTTGRAIGIDVWRQDLSGNRPEAVRENARLEGVAERVTVLGGDARSLPFADASFDVVVSALVFHNVRDREGRSRALHELARVLKPGGYVLLVDLRYTSEYVRHLRRGDVGDARRGPVWPILSPALRLVSWGLVHFCWVTGQKAPVSVLACRLPVVHRHGGGSQGASVGAEA
jgi:SAM-dependent methyltransferase